MPARTNVWTKLFLVVHGIGAKGAPRTTCRMGWQHVLSNVLSNDLTGTTILGVGITLLKARAEPNGAYVDLHELFGKEWCRPDSPQWRPLCV